MSGALRKTTVCSVENKTRDVNFLENSFQRLHGFYSCTGCVHSATKIDYQRALDFVSRGA